MTEGWELAATKTPPAPSGHPPHKGEGLAEAAPSPNKRHPLRRTFGSRWHRGAKERQNWRRVELEKNEAHGAAAIKPLPLVGRGWGGELCARYFVGQQLPVNVMMVVSSRRPAR
jgi:hypothetical protein